MNLLALPAAALSLVGRKGTLVVAASLFVGLAIPALAAACKPYLGEAIVVMLTLAFLRVDPVELRHHFTQPGLIAAATLWVMLVVPAAARRACSWRSGSTERCPACSSCWCCKCRRPA